MSRVFRVVTLLLWLDLGLVLVLVPWSNAWEVNYFIYQYPALGFFVKNSFLRGAVSGLGVMNVLMSLDAFRHRTATLLSRT